MQASPPRSGKSTTPTLPWIQCHWLAIVVVHPLSRDLLSSLECKGKAGFDFPDWNNSSLPLYVYIYTYSDPWG